MLSDIDKDLYQVSKRLHLLENFYKCVNNVNWNYEKINYIVTCWHVSFVYFKWDFVKGERFLTVHNISPKSNKFSTVKYIEIFD